MTLKALPLSSLRINRANDRHGELENETAAIAWLFNHREQHMKNLAKDIVTTGQIYMPPIVAPEGDGDGYLVFDGNRRVTCLKLLDDPKRAPTVELQKFFEALREKWSGNFPSKIECTLENDHDRIDDILYRLHTGTRAGVGQTTWDDRMKANFVNRTGKGGTVNVAEEIEKVLASKGLLPKRRKMPRSNVNRLLSSETFRNRVGITVAKGKFGFTHEEEAVLAALERMAADFAERKVVLGDIWDVDDKMAYLDGLEKDGVLPTPAHRLSKPRSAAASAGGPHPKTSAARPAAPTEAAPAKPSSSKPEQRTTLIPKTDFGLPWPARLQRHRQIWQELQHHLQLTQHPNAISVLFRVLLELSVENYIEQTGVQVGQNDKLAKRVEKVAADLLANQKIDRKYHGELLKFQHSEKLISADTFNRYVHSPNFAPSPQHLTALWDSLAPLIVCCLNA